MQTMPQRIIILSNWFSDYFWNIITGFIFAVLAYFSEVKGAIHVMWAAFILDLIIGIIASRRIRKEPFKMEKAFIAFSRMCIASLLIMLLYAMDREMTQDFISMYKTTAWIISGFTAYSIAKNGFELTGSKLFLIIKSTIGKKVEENTGVNIED
jgi:hypothetical protein